MRKPVFSLFTLALLCSSAQSAQLSKISKDAATTDAAALVQVIVQWNTPIGTATSAKIVSLGGHVNHEFPTVRQGVYFIPGAALSSLNADPTVKYVSVDRAVKHKLATTAATINAPQIWHLGFIGTGVGVAVLDSGINPDLNLGTQALKTVTYTQDFTPSAHDASGRPTASYGADWYGHGQHIAGIIASNGTSSTCAFFCANQMIGIASGASLIDLKVLDSTGEGTDSQVIAAIDQAITLKNTYNIRVMNLSLGRPVYESYTQDPLCQAVEAAWQAGIVVVVATGNDGRDNSNSNQGYGTILAPGNDPYVITVGAMKTMGTPSRADDLVASYSSKGPTAVDGIVKPDLVAPGNLIVSLLAHNATLPLTAPQNAVTTASISGGLQPFLAPMGGTPPANPAQQPPLVNFGLLYSNNYYTLSGTSMAAAVVSGSVADLIQAYPKLTPDQVKILLMLSASKTFPQSSTVVDNTGNSFTDYYDIFTIGAGYLDLQAAMNQVAQVPASGNSLSPVSSYNSTSGKVYLSFAPQSAWTNQSVWSNKSLWGANAVWSSAVLSGTQTVANSKSMWGVSTDTAAGSLWSQKSVWGASSDESAGTDNAQSVEITGEN